MGNNSLDLGAQCSEETVVVIEHSYLLPIRKFSLVLPHLSIPVVVTEVFHCLHKNQGR